LLFTCVWSELDLKSCPKAAKTSSCAGLGRYSRNLDPRNGQGIELIYLPRTD
jgi:hypothetical protein